MARQKLTTIKPDEETDTRLRILSDFEHRTKLDELRFLIDKRMTELDIKEENN